MLVAPTGAFSQDDKLLGVWLGVDHVSESIFGKITEADLDAPHQYDIALSISPWQHTATIFPS